MVIVGRPINGISINGLEYLLDENGVEMKFENEMIAIDFLLANNIAESEMDSFVFEPAE